MSNDDWKTLIARYLPPDKRVCNCRCAYATRIPNGAMVFNEAGKPPTFTDSWQCQYGCSAAQIAAQDHVAKQVLNELSSRNPP